MAQPIDGNQIVRENRARNALGGSSGMIHNRSTGETASFQSDQAAQPYTPQPQQPPQKETAYYKNDLMDADPEYAGHFQAKMFESGEAPSYEEFEKAQESEAAGELDAGEMGQEIQPYLQAKEQITQLLLNADITLAEVYEKIPEELGEYVTKLEDPSLIKTHDDLIGVSMVVENLIEQSGLDAEHYWSTGEIREYEDDYAKKKAGLEVGRW